MICPEQFLDELADFVGDRRARWELRELHATSLRPGYRIRICRFIAASPLQLLVQATDTDVTDRSAIAQWRLAQAANLRKSLDWYRRRGGKAADVEAFLDAHIKRVALQSQISDAEFVQAVLLVDLVHAALQKSLVFFTDDRWRPDFQRFAFLLDAKLPGKLGAGEKFLSAGIVPMLGSNARFRLELSREWKDADPPHPFVERYSAAGGWSGVERRRVKETTGDLSGIFEDGLRFESSDDHPGLQLADLVAWVARDAVLHPNDRQTRLAYELLKPKLRHFGGRTLRVIRLNTSKSDADPERYRGL